MNNQTSKHTIKELQEIFLKYLSQQNFYSNPKELYDPIVYSMNLGGKRLRPVMLLKTCEMFGGDYSKALDAAVGLEMFHNFTLVHDDIMDQAPLRRGKETVYKKWNPNIAILAGDTMFAIAFNYMMRLDDRYIRTVMRLFNKTAIEVCEGQQFDLNYEKDDSVTVADYLNMIRLKTAVLIAAALKLGAIIGDATEAQCDAIYQFGIETGYVFQLMDDWLDAYSDNAQFGKTCGGDIIEGKKTYLYLKSLEVASTSDRQKIIQYYNDPIMPHAEKIEKVKAIWNRLDIQQLISNEMMQHHQKSLEYLTSLQLDNATDELRQYAEDLVKRTY
ncbi:MAG: polyprenyl synthetase family protein [Bacteroidales bacterium]|nr:polyprenyl synthetase family protein [Bacteroidales bacterium]